MPFLSSGASSSHGQLVTVHQQSPPTSTVPKMSVFEQFNLHAHSCPSCRRPLEVHRRGEQLCDEGHKLAIEVARTLYKMAGEKATQYYGLETCHVSLLVDFTNLDGPVYELAKAMDKGLSERYGTSKSSSAAVHYARPEQSQYYHGSPSSSGYYYTSSASSQPSARRESRDRREEVPRRSGNIRVNLPVEYGREASYYEEICHKNGGRVTTKYYHTEAPRPAVARSNSIAEPAVSKPTRRSTVHWDPEVKYYK